MPSARRKSVDLERFRLTSLNLAQPDDTLSWRRRAQDRMAAYLSRLRDKKEPPRHGYCSRWIGHWLFEVLSAAVIISDCAMTVYNADYQMEHLRPVNGAFVFAFEWFLVAYYSLELAMKLTVHRLVVGPRVTQPLPYSKKRLVRACALAAGDSSTPYCSASWKPGFPKSCSLRPRMRTRGVSRPMRGGRRAVEEAHTHTNCGSNARGKICPFPERGDPEFQTTMRG